jgi:hypothetical protein
MSFFTPAEVATEIQRLCQVIEGKCVNYARLAHEAGEREADYRVKYAQTLLVSLSKTVAEREAEATVECERELRARKAAEAVADACRESIRAARDQLNAVQSIGANLRAEMQLSGIPVSEQRFQPARRSG